MVSTKNDTKTMFLYISVHEATMMMMIDEKKNMQTKNDENGREKKQIC